MSVNRVPPYVPPYVPQVIAQHKPSYLENLSNQLRQRPDLVSPLQPQDGRAQQFALADGSTLSVKSINAPYGDLFELVYPRLNGNPGVTFQLLIQSSPQGQRLIIRTNASVTPQIISLENSALSVEDGVLKIDGRDLRTLFRVPFNRESANAGSKLREPPPNVKLPSQLDGQPLKWDTSSGPNSVWLLVNGQVVGLPGVLRQDEHGSLVMWERGKGVMPLEDAIRRAVQALQNRP